MYLVSIYNGVILADILQEDITPQWSDSHQHIGDRYVERYHEGHQTRGGHNREAVVGQSDSGSVVAIAFITLVNFSDPYILTQSDAVREPKVNSK